MKYLGSHFIKISCVNIKVFSPLDRREAGVKIINQPTIWLSLTNENQVWSWRPSDFWCLWRGESDVRPGVGHLYLLSELNVSISKIEFHFISSLRKSKLFLLSKMLKCQISEKTFFGSKVFLFKVISFCLFEKFFFWNKTHDKNKNFQLSTL